MAEIGSGSNDPNIFDFEDHDMAELVYQATSQIPKGMVSTYGAIARALGDIRAARAVGMILSENPTPIVVPCHRIVYNDGNVGWYSGKGCGKEKKETLLREEGVEIEAGRVVGLPSLLFKDFKIEPLLMKMRLRQEELKPQMILYDDFPEPNVLVGLDVAYKGDEAFAAMATKDVATGFMISNIFRRGRVKFPYVPTYLTYRELPILAQLIDRTRQDIIYLVDGQGRLHPRGFGIACHLGVSLDVPTVGVAKSLLVGKVEENDSDESPIRLGDEIVGVRLSLSKNRPLYVSAGHRVSLGTAVEMVRKATEDRERDPLRIADRLSKEQRRERSMREG